MMVSSGVRCLARTPYLLLAGLLLSGIAPASAQTAIIDYNFDTTGAAHGYSGGDATGTHGVVSGIGVGGSNGAELNLTFGNDTNNFAGGGVQVFTTANANLTETDLSKILVSFDARASAPSGLVELYVQTWTGAFGGYDGIRITSFAVTDTYQTYSFLLSDIPGDALDPTHETMQVSWQIGTWNGWAHPGQHILDIDNVLVTTIRGQAAVPEPGAVAVLIGAAIPGAILARRRRTTL